MVLRLERRRLRGAALRAVLAAASQRRHVLLKAVISRYKYGRLCSHRARTIAPSVEENLPCFSQGSEFAQNQLIDEAAL